MSEYDDKGRRIDIVIWYPELPPSANAIYFGGTRLTDKAREYKERFRQNLQQNYGHQLSEFAQPNVMGQDDNGKIFAVKTLDPNLIFGIELVFYMDCLSSWESIELSPSRKAKFRFAKTDLTNRIKFVEDCFKSILDIDDSLTFESFESKVHSPDNQGVYIHYYAVPVEKFKIPRR